MQQLHKTRSSARRRHGDAKASMSKKESVDKPTPLILVS